MTDIIQELRSLIAKATPGPWASQVEPQSYPECDDKDYPATISGAGKHIALLQERYDANLAQVNDVDAALIVAAINHLPALLDRLEAAERGWQPIETAPKDGTTIDVWRDGTRETVYWGFPPHCCGEMGQYCDSDWHGIKKPGWICSTFGEFIGGKHDPFTHWRPLPAGPAEDGKL